MKNSSTKTCKVCGSTMQVYNTTRRYCSYDCMNKDKKATRKRPRIKASKPEIQKRKCATCNMEFSAFKTTDKYCSFKCIPEQVKTKVSKSKQAKTDPLYQRAREILIAKVEEENGGYLSCQHCKKSAARTFEVHHIVYRSERPGSPHMHHQRNLILVCDSCHEAFHNHKNLRNQLVIERGLDKLFDLTVVSQESSSVKS